MRHANAGKLALVACALFATQSFAQVRHDERPHGAGAPAQAKQHKARSATPGRHDEKPHGRTASRKQAAKSEPAFDKKDAECCKREPDPNTHQH